MTRREFVGTSGGCLGYVAAVGPLLSTSATRRWTGVRAGRVVAQEPFARIEEIGTGLWAVISTPLGGDYTTLCNGGIVQGSAGTVIIEAFATPDGARWVAERARELTGSWPSHVVVSHYHGDHSAGPAGYRSDHGTPALHATGVTRDLVTEGAEEADLRTVWADVVVLPDGRASELDLGDRHLSLLPRSGHTASDVTVHVDGGGGPIWCGDLVWNAMFPNYMDATPSRLSESVRAIAEAPSGTYVPGHGPLADAAAIGDYLILLDSVEEAAREALRRGQTARAAAEDYQVPAALGEWTLFNPRYYERAIGSWMNELG